MPQNVPVTPSSRRRIILAALTAAGCLAVLFATPPTLEAQKAGGGTKPSSAVYTGVTATFRCSGAILNGSLTSSCADGMLGDGSSYIGNPAASTTAGAFIWTSGSYDDFFLKLDGSGGRSLFLDFRDLSKAATCGSGCRMNFDVLAITRTLLEQGLLVRPANGDGSDLVGGMHKIGVGQTVPAKLKMNFPDPNGTTLWWTLRYNPRDYAGSSFVYVTRTGTKSWTISAGGYLTPDGLDQGIAELVASPDGGTRKQTHEGWYLMPFSLTVVQP